MPNVARVRVVWTGAQVTGGGLSTLYVDEAATGFVADLRAFFEAIKAVIPSGITITIPPTGDLLDEATGALSGSWSDTGASAVICSGSGAFVGGAGLRVRWATNGIRNGRRVRGSTFIAPVMPALFDTNGTPNSDLITLVDGAASTLRTALGSEFLVYSRPSGSTAGQSSVVIGHDVPDAASWLRSRRT